MHILLPLVVFQTTEAKMGHKSKQNGCIQTGKVGTLTCEGAYSFQLLRMCAGTGVGGRGTPHPGWCSLRSYSIYLWWDCQNHSAFHYPGNQANFSKPGNFTGNRLNCWFTGLKATLNLQLRTCLFKVILKSNPYFSTEGQASYKLEWTFLHHGQFLTK